MDRDVYSGIQVLAGVAVAFLVLGAVGLRWRSARLSLAILTPAYALVVFLYFLVAGAGSTCDGAGATFRCWEISYASTWGWLASLLVAAVILASATPIASAGLRSRTPSVVGSVALLALIAIDPLGLWIWFPAVAGVLGAAVAGPPTRRLEVSSAPI